MKNLSRCSIEVVSSWFCCWCHNIWDMSCFQLLLSKNVDKTTQKPERVTQLSLIRATLWWPLVW